MTPHVSFLVQNSFQVWSRDQPPWPRQLFTKLTHWYQRR